MNWSEQSKILSTFRLHILVIFVLLFFPSFFNACTKEENPVVRYLQNAEIQCEGDEQKANIVNALNDILTLSEDQLQQQRYKDYQGNEQQWDLPTLLHKHFVTDSNNISLGNNVFHDIKKSEAQQEVKEILKKLSQIK